MVEAVKYVLDEYDKLISYVNNLNLRIKEQQKQIEELQRVIFAQRWHVPAKWNQRTDTPKK